MPLTAKQQRLVDEYLMDFSAAQAATRAGYSEKTAYPQGQRLLKIVEIGKCIAAKAARTAERLDLSAERVLRGLFEEAALSKQSLYENLQRGEIASPERSFEEEEELIAREGGGFGRSPVTDERE